jgi:uncharacterized protein (TIGR03382 family)
MRVATGVLVAAWALVQAPNAWAVEDAGPAASDAAPMVDLHMYEDVPPPPNCTMDSDCGPESACYSGYCTYVGAPCSADADCGPMNGCVSGHCQWVGCKSDAECGPGNICNPEYAGCQGKPCAANTDCPEGFGCMYGSCADTKGMCQTGGDCSNYSVCSTGGEVIGGDIDAGGAVPAYDAGSYVDVDPFGPDIPGVTWTSWGQCVIDVPNLPESATCAAICAVTAKCLLEAGPGPAEDIGPSWDAGSSFADASYVPAAYQGPGASPKYAAWAEKVCNAQCQFALGNGIGASEADALASCLDGNPACDAAAANCEEQTNAAQVLWNGSTAVLPSDLAFPPYDGSAADDPTSSGDYAYAEDPPTNWDASGSGSYDATTGVPADSDGADAGNSASTDAVGSADATKSDSSAVVSGGCAAGGPAAAPLSAALLLLAFGALLRRRAR